MSPEPLFHAPEVGFGPQGPIQFNDWLTLDPLLATIIATGCPSGVCRMSVSKYAISDLPELPLEALSLGGELGPAKTEPVLTILPREFVEPDKPTFPSDPKTTHICRASSYYVRRYITQVTYPRVICYPNNAPTDQVMQKVFKEQEVLDTKETPRSKADLPQIRYYKLSNYQNKKLENPIFCTVHGGPWAAIVIETQSCDCEQGSTRWEFYVYSLPQLDMVWYGLWEDIPSDIHPNLGVFLNDLHLVNENFFCCPGYIWCETTHSCIPQTVNCKPPQL